MAKAKPKVREREREREPNVSDGKLPVVLITNCTASQSVSPDPALTGSSLPTGMTNEDAAALWCDLITKQEPSIPPAELYRGISFYSISRARSIVDPKNIYIVSIGQGLVGLTQPISPYDVSIDPNHKNSLTRVVTLEPFKPQFWWQLVNEGLTSRPYPITRLVEETDAKIVIISCTNRFQALITEDLLELVQSEDMRKVRIVCGSTASLPNQLKPYAVVYDKRMNKHSIGNRNDFNQRAALHFLRLIHSSPGILLDGTLEEHKAVVQDELNKIAPPPEGGKQVASASVDALINLLENDKSLLAMSPDAAYTEVQRRHKITVSSVQFRKVWRKVKGLSAGGGGAPVSASSDAAKRALEAVAGKLNRSSGHTSWADEEEALKAIRMFADLVREAQPDATFGSAEVYAWAQQYYAELQKSPPVQLKSVGKLAHLLRSYTEDLGLESIGGGQQGGNIYRAATGAGNE